MTRFLSIFLLTLGLAINAHADARDLLQAGLTARNRGDFDAAINYFSQAIDTGQLSRNDLATVMASRGVVHALKGATDKAVADFDSAIRLNPWFGEAYLCRGLARAKVRDYERAVADFTEAARVEPRGAFLALMNRGNAYSALGNNDAAIADYSEGIRLNPSYASSYYNRGNTYQAMEEFDKAIADFDAAIRLKPAFPDALINRAAAYLAEGETDKAIADLDKAIEFNPHEPAGFGNRGTAHMIKRDYAQALADYDEAIRLEPNSAWGFGNRGIARFYAGERDAAIEDFLTAVRLRPSDATMVIWLHSVHARAGKDDLQELEKSAAGVDRSRWPGPLVDLHLGLVNIEAVRAMALPTGGPRAQRARTCELSFHVGTFLLEHGRRDEARRELQAAADQCLPSKIEGVAAKAELAALELN